MLILRACPSMQRLTKHPISDATTISLQTLSEIYSEVAEMSMDVKRLNSQLTQNSTWVGELRLTQEGKFLLMPHFPNHECLLTDCILYQTSTEQRFIIGSPLSLESSASNSTRHSISQRGKTGWVTGSSRRQNTKIGYVVMGRLCGV